jgi:hypothetical protein
VADAARGRSYDAGHWLWRLYLLFVELPSELEVPRDDEGLSFGQLFEDFKLEVTCKHPECVLCSLRRAAPLRCVRSQSARCHRVELVHQWLSEESRRDMMAVRLRAKLWGFDMHSLVRTQQAPILRSGTSVRSPIRNTSAEAGTGQLPPLPTLAEQTPDKGTPLSVPAAAGQPTLRADLQAPVRAWEVQSIAADVLHAQAEILVLAPLEEQNAADSDITSPSRSRTRTMTALSGSALTGEADDFEAGDGRYLSPFADGTVLRQKKPSVFFTTQLVTYRSSSEMLEAHPVILAHGRHDSVITTPSPNKAPVRHLAVPLAAGAAQASVSPSASPVPEPLAIPRPASPPFPMTMRLPSSCVDVFAKQFGRVSSDMEPATLTNDVRRPSMTALFNVEDAQEDTAEHSTTHAPTGSHRARGVSAAAVRRERRVLTGCSGGPSGQFDLEQWQRHRLSTRTGLSGSISSLPLSPRHAPHKKQPSAFSAENSVADVDRLAENEGSRPAS